MAVANSPVDIENLKGAIDLGKQGLKSLELVNGGAVIAILTFYGNVVKDGSKTPIEPKWLAFALGAFALGVGAALVATTLAYLGQVTVATAHPDQPENPQKDAAHLNGMADKSMKLLNKAVCVAAISLLLFLAGTGFSMTGFVIGALGR